jgi:predicted short-subunit dehydrogenase-like oxidoreductase (DUF2520 family)
MHMRSLNLIGAGRLGRTLGRLWSEERVFAVQDVLDGSEQGAASAVAFIGAGRTVGSLEAMQPAEVWLIATPDRVIAGMAEAMGCGCTLRPGDIVFHCSGSQSSTLLAPAAACGAAVASVHPLKTFADPREAVRTFAGTWCVIEGDPAALEVLVAAFERIGGRMARIEAQRKVIYHAASVIVCNYLTALMEAGLRCYERAGVDRDTAIVIMQPIVRETLENVLSLGPAQALTGPIARGDGAVVERHLAELTSWDGRMAALYRDLGAIALELARSRGEADAAELARLAELLNTRSV